MSYGYTYGYQNPRRGKLSKAEKKKRAETRRRNRIKKEFNKTIELYEYDTIVLSAVAARHYGFDVYWSICANGHIGEFNLKGKCKTCRKVHRSIRDAKKRGSAEIRLTKKEKQQVAEIYAHARRLTIETAVEHHVDHIRPLAAGGEHHPANLQVIPAAENLSKGSKYDGKLRTYGKQEKREQAAILKEKRSQQLDQIFEERYIEEMGEYEKLHWFRRFFISKPVRKVAP